MNATLEHGNRNRCERKAKLSKLALSSYNPPFIFRFGFATIEIKITFRRKMIETSRFITLPTDIICLILAEWLELKEVARVDSAFCNHKQRIILEGNVFPHCVLQEEPMPLQAGSVLMWMTKRKISMAILVLRGETAIAKYLHFLDTSSNFVKRVKITDMRGKGSAELLQVLSKCSNVVSLSFEACQLVNTTASQAWYCPTKLQSFSIDVRRKCCVEKDIAVDVIRSSQQQLQRLELLMQPEFVLCELVDIKTFPRLMALSICCADNISDTEVTDALLKAPHLVHLNVSMCQLLTDVTGLFIAENVSQLKTLDVSFCDFTNATLSALARLRMNTLYALNIHSCVYMHGTGLYEVFKMCVNLRVLHTDVHSIVRCLMQCPDLLQNLTHLTFGVNSSSASLYCSRHIPYVCSKAQCISFYSHHVSYGEIDFSAYTSQNMPNLHTINISSYPLPSPGVCPSLDALQVQRPELRVMFNPLHNYFDVMKLAL